ncbi:adenylyl-sulfate kinase [Pararobbsia silviterrae]|uniref:Adenylyl-sulfate kinase n=1 Tax=Pararobbsia silviterrae TaxID=1792498 RepID=A0A494YB01_9BURK|nr:adenylyl-sulfate kinase [Pararobbsia silviterrae]RKP57825.1 adenylyl-sulfate kinase [Pararobbsia silviterrae]
MQRVEDSTIDEARDGMFLPLRRALHGEPKSRKLTSEGGVVWLTGLSGSGKSTLASAAAKALSAHGMRSAVLDGDILRRGLNSDLNFSACDRHESVRRAAEVASMLANEGLIAIVALISPLVQMRAHAREIIGDRFREIYVKAQLSRCEAADVKGLYAKARRGEIAGFTGISAPYEAPLDADLVLDTDAQTVGQCVSALASYVELQFVASWDTRGRSEWNGFRSINEA